MKKALLAVTLLCGFLVGGIASLPKTAHADMMVTPKILTNTVARMAGTTPADLPPDGIFLISKMNISNQVVMIMRQVHELHADSETNIVWKSVFKDGYHTMKAFTNDVKVVYFGELPVPE